MSMSSVPPSLYEVICTPSTRVRIDTVVFLLRVLPSVLGYTAIAVLAVVRGTRTLRRALWPVVASLAWRAAVTVDMSAGEPNRKFLNNMFVFSMIFIVTRTLDWSLVEAPFTRHTKPTKGSRSIFTEGLGLAFTLRGHGWDWSRAHIPHETRPSSRKGFAIYVVLSAIVHILAYAVAREVVVAFSPMGIGALSGGSIFDATLPFCVRYFRASLITAVAAVAVYAFIQASYDICTITGVFVFGQDPAQWPPAFDAPWRATSLSDFWGRRWHQFFRRLFLVQGGYPLSFFLGRAGLIVGSFLSSAAMHHIPLLQLNPELEAWRMLVGFGVMAPLVLAEELFRQTTGRKVSGCVGWIWTMAWLLIGGNMLLDGFARAGVFGHLNFAKGLVPGRAVIERTVGSFDRWLHAI